MLVFSFFAGVIAFALTSSSKGNEDTPGNTNGTVYIWGVYNKNVIDSAIEFLSKKYDAFSVIYVEKRPETFDTELIEAIADGRGPDIVLLPQDSLMRHYNKLYAIPYTNFTQRQFRDTYIQEGELYLAGNGIVGFPLLVDPLVMFWNRSIFNSEGLAQPPRNWEEFQLLARDITRKDVSGNIIRGTVAFGEYANVNNAKEILSALFLQSGNPMAVFSSNGMNTTLRSGGGVENALQFYTGFADPVRPFYTWNRSLRTSRTTFLAGDLALYFGFGSEISELRSQNPNLDFDITVIPQPKDSLNRVTFGRMQGLSILNSSRNVAGSFVAVQMLSGKEVAQVLADASNLPPVRRDMYTRQTDKFKTVLYESALISKAWFDPDKVRSDMVFKSMIESIISGSSMVSVAIQRADELLTSLYRF